MDDSCKTRRVVSDGQSAATDMAEEVAAQQVTLLALVAEIPEESTLQRAQQIELVVRSMHPVAESGGGLARFRVRADLLSLGDQYLRPGESGYAHLAIGQTSFVGRLAQPILKQLETLRWRVVG